jgi:peroxiredoxin Q/BCP
MEEYMLLKVGDQAPQFNLKNQDGINVSLEDLKGKRFILWFYPKASTPG